MQEVELGLVNSGWEITKVVQTESGTSEVSDIELIKPEIDQPESEVCQPESPLFVIAPTPKPPSPRRKLIIMTELSPRLISIKDIPEIKRQKYLILHLLIVNLLTQEFLSLLSDSTIGVLPPSAF